MKSLQYLNKYLWKYKWLFLLGVIFMVISNYFGVKMPIYVKESIDQLLGETNIDSFEDGLWLSLKLGGIYMLLSFMKGLFLFFVRQTIIKMSRLIEYDLKNEIYLKYQKLDFAFLTKNSTGDLMNRISEDVSLVRMYLGPGIMYSVNLVILASMIIYQMVTISPLLTLFTLVPLPIMSVLIFKVSKKMNLYSKETQEEQSNLSKLAQETFAGIRILKSYGATAYKVDQFSKSSEDYKKKSMQLVLVNALFIPTMLLLIGTSTICTIYLGGLMNYDNQISLGGIIAFIFFVNNLTWPFASIGWVTSIVQRAEASQKRINDFLKITSKIVNTSNNKLEKIDSIEFDGVQFIYENTGIEALKNVTFKIEKGQTVAFVGKTGSGKSTILSLLTRLYDRNNGSIAINGIDIKELNLYAYRESIGAVPQDVFLFSDTIKNNLLFGNPTKTTSLDDIQKYTKLSHVHHSIEKFEKGYDTLLGERGVNLSGGQKQRITIARALLKDPQLVLLDDCLSAVDTETEEIILQNLRKYLSDKTCVMVSHRVSTVKYADKIFYLEGGEIVESGSHTELLKAKGKYYKLHKDQLQDDENKID